MDSYFEYLLKGYVLFGSGKYYRDYVRFSAALDAHSLFDGFIGTNNPHNGTAAYDPPLYSMQMFWPVLQAMDGKVSDALRTYANNLGIVSAFGVPPEAFVVWGDVVIPHDQHYLIRPEFIEATLYLFRVTGLDVFQRIGLWQLRVIERMCRVKCGLASVADIDSFILEDHMDSFALGFVMSAQSNEQMCVLCTERH